MRIYVGNISYETTEQDLREAFEAHGEVNDCALIKDRDTGRSKGFAFIEMPTSEEGQSAITTLNGKELSGRTIVVNEARPRVERSFGGGGRGPGNSGGGYGNDRGRRGGGGNRRDSGGRGSRW